MVVDLGNGEVNVTKLKLKNQQIEYVRGLGEDLPQLRSRTGTWRPVEEWDDETFAVPPETKGKGTAPKPVIKRKKPPERRTLITRDCQLTVKSPKIQEIEQELRTLHLSEHKHAIAVLFRVFLETSVDYFLSQSGVDLFVIDKGGHKRDKSLQAKVTETIAQLVRGGIPEKNLDGVAKGIHDKKNALSIDTLHAYVHNQFYSPKESDLTTAFDNARPFFEAIWK